MKNNNGRVALLSILNVIRSLVLIATAYISKMFVDCYDFETNVLSAEHKCKEYKHELYY